MKATRQLVSLCLGIGMTIGGHLTGFAQDVAKADPPHSYKAFHTPIKALTIGDQVPDLQFENVLNYKSKTAKLSDFKGKLVILDMWSTSCTACIAAFPKLEKLQNDFGNRIQILLVNPHSSKYDSEARIVTILENLKKRTNFFPSLPIPIHDSILNTYFPHQSVPHQVWIDASGKVVAITGSIDMTEENIKAAIEGKDEKIPVKDDWAFDTKTPLLVNGNGGASNDFVYRSVFTKYIGGIGFSAGLRKNEKNEAIGMFILNATLRDFVTRAYAELMMNFTKARILVESDYPSKFNSEYNSVNAYCYDITIPPTADKMLNVNKFLREDLSRFFNISVRKEKRTLNCLVIKANENVNNLATKYKKEELDLDEKSIKKYFHNYSVEKIFRFLEWGIDTPLILETPISNSIDIELPQNLKLTDSKAVVQILQNAGFEVSQELREIDVIIISDK